MSQTSTAMAEVGVLVAGEGRATEGTDWPCQMCAFPDEPDKAGSGVWPEADDPDAEECEECCGTGMVEYSTAVYGYTPVAKRSEAAGDAAA